MRYVPTRPLSSIQFTASQHPDYFKGDAGGDNRDYHQLSHFEISGAKRISRHLSVSVSGRLPDFVSDCRTFTCDSILAGVNRVSCSAYGSHHRLHRPLKVESPTPGMAFLPDLAPDDYRSEFLPSLLKGKSHMGNTHAAILKRIQLPVIGMSLLGIVGSVAPTGAQHDGGRPQATPGHCRRTRAREGLTR